MSLKSSFVLEFQYHKDWNVTICEFILYYMEFQSRLDIHFFFGSITIWYSILLTQLIHHQSESNFLLEISE